MAFLLADTLAAAAELTLNQISLVMVDLELSLFVIQFLLHQRFRQSQQLRVLLALLTR